MSSEDTVTYCLLLIEHESSIWEDHFWQHFHCLHGDSSTNIFETRSALLNWLLKLAYWIPFGLLERWHNYDLKYRVCDHTWMPPDDFVANCKIALSELITPGEDRPLHNIEVPCLLFVILRVTRRRQNFKAALRDIIKYCTSNNN